MNGSIFKKLSSQKKQLIASHENPNDKSDSLAETRVIISNTKLYDEQLFLEGGGV